MKNRWVTVLPKNYRRIVLAAIERAVDPVLFMNGEQVTTFAGGADHPAGHSRVPRFRGA